MKATFRMAANFAVIIGLFAALFSYAMFQGGFVSWFLFFAFLPIFVYQLTFLLYPLTSWKVTRKLSGQMVQAGGNVAVDIEVERKFPFPLYYCIIEEIFPKTLMKADGRQEKYRTMNKPFRLNVNRKIKKMLFPGMRKQFAFSYSIQQIPRGEHHLQHIRIRTGDLFGFLKKETILQLDDYIHAYPGKLPLQMTQSINSLEQGSVSSAVNNLTNTNVAAGVREYAPGDRFSWIDWKQTARKSTVMTKEFEQEKSTETIIVLDSCKHNEMNPIAYEATVELVLSLLESFRKQSHLAGFLNIGKEAAVFPAEQNDGKRKNISQFLTRVQPDGERPFSVKLKQEMSRVGSGNSLILVTTHMDDFLKQTLQQLRQSMQKVTLIIIQPSATSTEVSSRMIQQLRYLNINVQVLNEQQLVMNPIGVNLK